jgi:hypothetical protein
MQFTKRQRHVPEWARQLAAVLGVGLLLGFSGPFGTYPALPRPVRYAFWVGLSVAGLGAVWAARRLLGARGNGPVGAALTALGSALPMTFLVEWVMLAVQPGRTFVPGRLPGLFVAVAAVQLVIVLATFRRPLLAHEPDSASPSRPEALLARLPPEVGTELVALQAEDHYLRVHTRSGSALILMRLSDAIAAAGDHGLQVHRSWWVARDAVAKVGRSAGRPTLELANGLVAPVGRTYAPAVRAAFGGRG